MAGESDVLAEALAEGLHKAMCYGPATLHNRLACERPELYLNLANAAIAHPAMVALAAAPSPVPLPLGVALRGVITDALRSPVGLDYRAALVWVLGWLESHEGASAEHFATDAALSRSEPTEAAHFWVGDHGVANGGNVPSPEPLPLDVDRLAEAIRVAVAIDGYPQSHVGNRYFAAAIALEYDRPT